MKRIAYALVALITILGTITMTSCQKADEQPPSFTTTIIDSGSALLKATDTEMVKYWQQWSMEPGTAPAEKTIVFDGGSYDGVFSHSETQMGRVGWYDTYDITDREKGLYFIIERDSGDLVSLDLMNDQNREALESSLPVPENPRENAGKEADRWAKKLLDKPEKYEKVDRKPMEGVWFYGFRYVRKVGETETLDYIGIGISDRGGLVYFFNYSSGWSKKDEKTLEALKTAPVRDLICAELEKQNVSMAGILNSYYGHTPENEVVLFVNCSVRVKGSMTVAATFLIGVE